MIEKNLTAFFRFWTQVWLQGGDVYWYMEQSEEVEKENKSNVKEKLQ